MAEPETSIARGTLIALVCRAINVAAGVLVVLLVSRELGDAGFGTFVLGTTVVGVVAALTGGLTAAAGYQINNQRWPAGEVLSSGGVVALALGVAAVIGGLVLRESLAGNARTIGLEAGLAAAAVLMNGVVTGILLGQGRMVRYNLALAAPALFGLSAVVAVLYGLDERTPSAALGAFAAGQWLAFLPALLATRTAPSFRAVNRPLIGIMLRFSGFAALSSGISYLNYRADIFVVRAWEGEAGVGVYNIAVQLAEAVWQISGAVALAAIPRIAGSSQGLAAELTTRIMRHTLVLLGLACIVVALLADVGVGLFWGDDFSGAANALRILLPGTLVYGLAAGISGYYTYQRGRPWLAGVISSSSLVIDIALALVFVPRWGINGAALATSISYVLAMGAAAAYFLHDTRTSPAALFRFRRTDFDDYVAVLRRLKRGRPA